MSALLLPPASPTLLDPQGTPDLGLAEKWAVRR